MSASLRLRVHKAPLTETPPPPILLVGGPVSIGRRDDSGWVLPDSSANVSRKHATVEERNGVWLVVDESANGTLHNGTVIGRGNARPLTAGDMIKIGDYEILVEQAPDAGVATPRGVPMAPPVQPFADPYGVGDFARADFGAPPPPPSGPSPFDPPPQERLAEAPRGVDLFGDFGARQVDQGVGVRGGSEAPVAAFGGLDAQVDPLAPHAAGSFGASEPAPGSPFGAPPAASASDWDAPSPNPASGAGALVNDPFSNTGGGSVFGDQFGSADAIRNPLAGGAPRAGGPSAFGNEPSPFGAQDPVGYGREQAPAPLGFDAVAVPEIGGPGAGGAALPADWNTAPSSGPAPPPADLDPIEQALAGLKSPASPGPAHAAPMRASTPQAAGGAPAASSAASFSPQPAAFDAGAVRRPSPASPPPAQRSGGAPGPGAAPQERRAGVPEAPGGDFFGASTGPVEDAFAHPAAPTPAMTPQARSGTPVGSPSGPAPAPSPAFQSQSTPRPTPGPRPAPKAARPAAPAAGDALLRAFMEGAGLPQLPADLDPEQAMRNLGSSGRAIVSTLARLLEARRLLKGEFRITQTVVGARENNPLKFSVDESELMLVLLGSVRPGFQRGEAAVWDAGRDLEAHQLAMLAAFRAVLDAVFARLSPDAIASGEEAGFFGRLLPQARDAALWERYMKMYGDLRQDIGNTLAGRLGQIFAEAYEAENGRRGGSG